MKMGVVLPVRGSHGRDLLAAADPLPAADQHRVQVPVKGVDIADVAIFAVSVADDDHISPTQVDIARENNNAVANAVDRVAQIGVATADAVPIFTDMAAGPETTRFVVAFRLRLPNREIKTV